MSVESYTSVHQLVTTVEGQLKQGISSAEALGRCFPPGSMTGAPKKRSVAILEQIESVGFVANDKAAGSLAEKEEEDQVPYSRTCLEPEQTQEIHRDMFYGRERGPYSGILGFIGFDGAADFSVIIRTVVAEDASESALPLGSEQRADALEKDLSLGAGGAITYASDPAKEWQEVLDKAMAVAEIDVSSIQ